MKLNDMAVRKAKPESKDTLSKALKELLAGEWLEMTRQGGRDKATLYALTFYAIDDCKGNPFYRSGP